MIATGSSRAHIATDPSRSRGRRYDEDRSPTRSCFQRDRDRIIHASAFRRLKGKTQVFVAMEGDHFRTRLTHSLEVAQLARSAARSLGLDEDLAEALALAHDLGHPPFGHAGEDQLTTCMEPYGGFDHNAQTYRVVTRLEKRYPRFDGLNLSWETLEGLIKHNGPLADHLRPAYGRSEAVDWLQPDSFPGPEAQCAALADDAAYNNHDIDDGLGAGLFSLDDLGDLPLVGKVVAEVRSVWPDIEDERRRAETVRRLTGIWITDLISETRRRSDALDLASAAEIRALGQPWAGFSAELREAEQALRDFLNTHMYRHPKVERMRKEAGRIISDLFALFMEEPETLPDKWCPNPGAPKQEQARDICDYIAGMTDEYAIRSHRRLFNLTHWN